MMATTQESYITRYLSGYGRASWNGVGWRRTIPSMMKIHRHPLLWAKPAICIKPKARMPERAEAKVPMR